MGVCECVSVCVRARARVRAGVRAAGMGRGPAVVPCLTLQCFDLYLATSFNSVACALSFYFRPRRELTGSGETIQVF